MKKGHKIRLSSASLIKLLWGMVQFHRTPIHKTIDWFVERHQHRCGPIRFGSQTVGAVVGLHVVVGVASAQSNSICGTSIAKGTEQTAQLAIGILVLGCIGAAGMAEGYARIKRDPKATAELKKWRNSAAMGTVTTPALMWIIIRIAGYYNIPVVSCVELVPFL